MRDMDLVSDPGYHAAARYGVVAVEGGLSSYMPQRAFCFTDEARFPWVGGVRRPNAESDVGSR